MRVFNVGGVLRAVNFAARAHHGQNRKTRHGIEIPYITHCLTVAEWSCDLGLLHEQEGLQAAVLHDVPEDTRATIEQIDEEFTPMVGSIVRELTLPLHLRKRLTAEQREEKVQHQMNVMRTGSRPAGIIKTADKRHNVSTMVTEPPPWKVEAIRGYTHDSTRVVMAGLENPVLVNDAGFRILCEKYLNVAEEVAQFYGFKQ